MKKTVILLNDPILRSVFKRWLFRARQKEPLFFAKEGKEAIEIIKAQPIDLLITELSLPDMDGLELASHVAIYKPMIKIAFLLPTPLEDMPEKLQTLPSITFTAKPNSLKEFILLVQAIEDLDFKALLAQDMTIQDFLELIRFQKKTCLLTLQNNLTAEKGVIYFEHGILYDAACADFRAEQAVIEMLRWHYAKFTFKALTTEKFTQKIQTAFAVLLKKSQQITAAEPVGEFATEKVDGREDELHAKFAKQAECLAAKIQPLALASVLTPLQEINHYQAFAIFDLTGQLVVEHHMLTFVPELAQISANLAVIIKTVAKLLCDTGLNKFSFLQMNFEGGLFQAEWLVENQLVAAVFLTHKAQNPGLAKAHLEKVCQFIRQKL